MHRVEFEYVVGEHEEDGNKFNRGQAINVAAVWSIQRARENIMLVMHDVDLIPSPAHFERAYLPLYSGRVQLSHLASAWTKYSYPTFVGGVLAIESSMFVAIGGMPCDFFGWGGEDDVLYDRLKQKGFLSSMEPRLEKDDRAFTDLEASCEFKKTVPRKDWMNMTKREQLKIERRRHESSVEMLEQSRMANKTLTATSRDGKNTQITFSMHSSIETRE